MSGATPLVPLAPSPSQSSPQSAAGATRYMVQWDEHANHLATRLGYLLEHQSLVDVTLMCNTHTLKVHRAVLAACSPYFETVLQRQLGNHPLIVLKDMKFCVLKSLVEFMYCGETSVTADNLSPLMEAAKFFEVKGLSTMTKEVLNTSKGSSIKQENGTQTIPSYRGRGRRGGPGRGRHFPTVTKPAAPQEMAQIMLSLSGVDSNPPLQPFTVHNGTMGSTDLKTLREQLNIEPRRRGRGRGIGRGRIKDLIEGKYGVQAIKKEVVDVQKDLELLKSPEPKENGDEQSPLLASLLSKAEALGRTKIKTEKSPDGDRDEETVVYQFDGESNSATKYLDALKEAGLPTDVPVLIDAGDGTYVTLTEDVLRRVLGNSDEFQFQVTEATLERGEGEVCEAVVQKDGSVTVTGKSGRANGPLLTMGKRSVSIKGIKSKKEDTSLSPTTSPVAESPSVPVSETSRFISPVPEQLLPATPSLCEKKDSTPKKSVEELINEAVMESLRNGAANEAESDPDAVVLFEVTDNDKVCKYVVSSKEVSALKALNEQIEKKKNQNSPVGKKSPTLPTVPTVVDGNTNIAEIKLAKTSRKSIVSEVLARAHSLENQHRQNDSTESNGDEIKTDNDSSSDMLNIDMETDVLNNPSELMSVRSSNENSGTRSLLDPDGESQMSVDEKRMAEVNEDSEMMEMTQQDGGIDITKSEMMEMTEQDDGIDITKTLLGGCINMLNTVHSDLPAESNEDSQSLRVNEHFQDTDEAVKVASEIKSSNRDMPLLESEPEIVHIPLIDNNNEKMQVYKGADSNGVADCDHEKNNDVIGLLNVVRVEASQELTNIKDDLPDRTAEKENWIPSDHSDYIASEGARSTENSVLDEVQKLGELLDEGKCQELSVEQALQEMMGEENSFDYNEPEPENETEVSEGDLNLQPLTQVSESNHVDGSLGLAFETSRDPTEKPAVEALAHLPDVSTNVIEYSLEGEENCGRIAGENLESSLVSPTKDVPFAVGLLPLKDALEQMQAVNQRNFRKTRSTGLSKRENIGTKRRSSVDNFKEGTVKRRKSVEGDGIVKNGKADKQDWVPT